MKHQPNLLLALIAVAAILVGQVPAHGTEDRPRSATNDGDFEQDHPSPAGSTVRASGSLSHQEEISPAGQTDEAAVEVPAAASSIAEIETQGSHQPTQRQMEAFRAAMEEVFPMTPELVRKYRDLYLQNESAARDFREPRPLFDSDVVRIAPGDPPPTLYLSPGIASVIGFFNGEGQPWAISQHVVGNGEDYSVTDFGKGTNSLAISPLVRFGWTNIAVLLDGEASPVVARMVVDPEKAHFRHDIRVFGRKSLTRPRSRDDNSANAETSGNLLADLLTHPFPDSGSERVDVTGVAADAWITGDQLFLRTRHRLISPAWSAAASDGAGNRLYRLPVTSSLQFDVGSRTRTATIVRHQKQGDRP